ncbi:hypothetical protein [Sporichthya sp.]|uniref:hypothetical protein n=1 Tax=Sporichthya sp. TaxID=65475 RepID=UPI0017C9A899|nr:hypothetical protein [Sporichthya sp.]MBA3742319.1 hypothetical protein [Sporichthya sp.]
MAGRPTQGAAWTAGTGPNDRRLSGLTPRQTQRVRDLARQFLAENGLEAVVHDDHLRTADGREFGLYTLASKCHNAPLGEGSWPVVVRDYLGGLLAAYPDVPPPVTEEQLRERACLRLVNLHSLKPEAYEWYRYARRLGAGFVEMLVLAEDGFARFLNDADVALVGADELRGIARENLRAIEPDEYELRSKDDTHLHVVRGASGFIASKLLMLPEVLAVVPGLRTHYPDGLLVAVPNRHELAFTPLGLNAPYDLLALAEYAALMHTHGEAPLAPFVYWWRDGELTQLTAADAAGHLTWAAPYEFVEVIARMWDEPLAS